jgi:hypothetical protein
VPGLFDHVLLTRFSAVLRPGAPPADPAWLRYRLGFFYDACYASVSRQRDADFDWLVLLDDRCPDDVRADVEDLAQGVFTPLWSREPFRRGSFAEAVASRTDAPWLITTRIDSDDAMAVDLMASVQAQFARQERLFVSFTRGVQVDRSGAVYRSDMLSGPFLSLIERRTAAPPATVYVAKHARARTAGPVREVRAPVMWAQVVHDTNLSNIVNGPRVHPGVVRERFDLDLTYDDRIGGLALVLARLRQRGRLLRLWARHPGELTKHVEARAWRVVGTHERPRDDGATLTDLVQLVQRGAAARWQHSTARATAVRTGHAVRAVRWRLQAKANTADPRGLTVLTGSPSQVLGAARVAVLAEHSRRGRVRPGALALAQALAAEGYGVVLVAARDPWVRLSPPTQLPRPQPAGPVTVLRRPNLGYDFGSWAAVLAAYPGLATKDTVLLVNDSLVGPFGPVGELVRRAEASTADVWGVTASRQVAPHLQSYWLAFRRGALATPELLHFFAGVRPQAAKTDVVLAYEVALGGLLATAGLRGEAAWRAEDLDVPGTANPVLTGWEALLGSGFPFVKRQLLQERRFRALRPRVAAAVRRHYGVDLDHRSDLQE